MKFEVIKMSEEARQADLPKIIDFPVESSIKFERNESIKLEDIVETLETYIPMINFYHIHQILDGSKDGWPIDGIIVLDKSDKVIVTFKRKENQS